MSDSSKSEAERGKRGEGETGKVPISLTKDERARNATRAWTAGIICGFFLTDAGKRLKIKDLAAPSPFSVELETESGFRFVISVE